MKHYLEWKRKRGSHIGLWILNSANSIIRKRCDSRINLLKKQLRSVLLSRLMSRYCYIKRNMENSPALITSKCNILPDRYIDLLCTKEHNIPSTLSNNKCHTLSYRCISINIDSIFIKRNVTLLRLQVTINAIFCIIDKYSNIANLTAVIVPNEICHFSYLK
jgi:hypothetical protein